MHNAHKSIESFYRDLSLLLFNFNYKMGQKVPKH